MTTTHFLDVDDLSRTELLNTLDRAEELKAAEPSGQLADKTLAMLFEKESTRTRISFETGMTQLGGHAIFLSPDDTQLGRGEPLSDTARTLSRYVDAMMVRVFDHADAVEMAEYASVPVINGLTDDAHPCQTVADLLTIREEFGSFDVRAAWIGDGNNVAQSFVLGCAMVGIDLTVATPEGYGIEDSVLDRAAQFDGEIDVTTDPTEADVADVVYTDVWVSMGQEDERAEKLQAFEGFQLNQSLLDGQAVLHCLPAHRGEEITDRVLESDRALVWDQAENRLHAQNALLTTLIE